MSQAIACVIGDCDMVRPLGLAGIPVVAAGNTLPELRWSRHTVGTLELPHLWRESNAVVAELNRFARTQSQRPVLFYQTDSAVVLVSRHREELAQCFDFVIPAAELVEDLVDKSRFTELAARTGLSTPRTVIAECGDNGLEVDSWTYPVIIKPAVRDRGDDWSTVAGSGKAHRCTSAAELRQLLRTPELDGMEVLIQEEIPGTEDRIWSYHAFVDDSGQTRAEFTGQKIRTWPREFGLSSSVKVIAQNEVRDVGRGVLKAIDFTGVVKIDFKRNRDDELVVLEINPRFSLWHSPGARAGVNIPEIVYQYVAGSDVTAPPAVEGAQWCHPKNDLLAARADGVPLREWLSFVRSCSSRHALYLDDPLAIAGVLVNGLAGLLPRRHAAPEEVE